MRKLGVHKDDILTRWNSMHLQQFTAMGGQDLKNEVQS